MQEKEENRHHELDNTPRNLKKQMNTEKNKRFQVSPELCKTELFLNQIIIEFKFRINFQTTSREFCVSKKTFKHNAGAALPVVWG